jgi:homospermidine synthase
MFDTILLAGVGALGKSVLFCWDLMIPHIKYNKIILVEPRDLTIPMRSNWKHLQIAFDRDNYQQIIDQIDPDLFIDCTVSVDSISLIDYCQHRNIRYVNTSIEDWKDLPIWHPGNDVGTISLANQHNALRRNQRFGPQPTMVMECGMNPGMISHFAKYGILRLAEKKGVLAKTYGELAMKLGIKVIQCSEVDTQRIRIKVTKDTFINTWSAIGFIEEALDPVQVGWGSHEKSVGGVMAYGQHILPEHGMNVKCRGLNPLTGYYEGRVIPHGESTSLHDFLTYKDYSPSVYYVYKASPAAEQCLDNLKANNYKPQKYDRVITTNDVIDGSDAVGALFILENGECYWYGTVINKRNLDKEIYPYTNPTMVQVVSGVLTAIDYIDTHPNEGIIFPESIDSERAIELARPFLGEIYEGLIEGTLPTRFADLLV